MVLARVDELMNELNEHLRQIGINGTIYISESLEDLTKGALVGGVLGYIEIKGRDIDLIQVEMSGFNLTSDGFVRDSYPFYLFHYVVQANVKGLEESLKAEIKLIKKNFFSKDVVDFKWEGGEIARGLNADSDLKGMLLKGRLDQLPNIKIAITSEKTPVRQYHGITKQQKDNLKKTFDELSQYVRITKWPIKSSIIEAHEILRKKIHKTPIWDHRVGVEFPTRETLDIYERIAKHIHNIADR